MQMNRTLMFENDGMGNGKFYRINAIALIIAALISLSFSAQATVYTATLDGKYNDQNIWTPAYPGNIIQEEDTVIINNAVKMTSDIVVKGKLMIRKTGSFTGNKNVIILQGGSMQNFGLAVIEGLVNKGMVFNNHILEIAYDFINTGELINQQSMIVGNIVDNIGLITGNGGSLMANKKLVNSQTGSIRGNIDVCSANFLNVDGAMIDSTRLSFCGHRIFKQVYLSADIKSDNIQLSLKNSEAKNYKNIIIERSVDGNNYQEIANVNEKQLKGNDDLFQFVDSEVVKSNSIHYRVKLTPLDKKEGKTQTVTVDNFLSTTLVFQDF